MERINIHKIMELLPHRYPMLLLDRIIELVPGQRAVGLKNVTVNEPYFQGHFPETPVMPGVMIIEAMAQTGAAMVMYSLDAKAGGKLVYFMSIDSAKFRKPVIPGDQLHLVIEAIQNRGPVWKLNARALVEGTIAAEAVITAMIRE